MGRRAWRVSLFFRQSLRNLDSTEKYRAIFRAQNAEQAAENFRVAKRDVRVTCTKELHSKALLWQSEKSFGDDVNRGAHHQTFFLIQRSSDFRKALPPIAVGWFVSSSFAKAKVNRDKVAITSLKKNMATDAWNPNQYDKFKSERSQPFFDLLNFLRPTTHANVIDLGCGTGELTEELHRFTKAATTLGIDSSEEMLRKTEPFATSRLTFRLGNIENLENIDGWSSPHKFDVIFSNAALQWCSHHPELFKKLATALKPGGQLAIQMPMNHDYPTHVLARQMSHEKPWQDLLHSQSYEQTSTLLAPEEYASLLFKLGFANQRVELKVYGHVLDSRLEVIEWVKGTLLTHFKSRLGEADYQKFLSEYKERLFKILPDEKPFFYPFKRIFIWGIAP